MLCPLSINGLQEAYVTDGTFDRKKFVNCLLDFALKSGKVFQYPGALSIWIMDGAAIHCCPEIPTILRSLGIIPIYLPAYCPFFNPIELIFGYIKAAFKRSNKEGDRRNYKIVIGEVINRFTSKDCKKMFKKCGYIASGRFIPEVAFYRELFHAMEFNI